MRKGLNKENKMAPNGTDILYEKGSSPQSNMRDQRSGVGRKQDQGVEVICKRPALRVTSNRKYKMLLMREYK